MVAALAVAVAGQVLYHTVAKAVGGTRSPFELIAAAYIFAFICVVLIGYHLCQFDFAAAVSPANLFPAIAIGAAVSCVEIGYVMAYKYGLELNTGALTAVAITAIILIPIGIWFFDEMLTPKLIAGVIITLFGLWLIRG